MKTLELQQNTPEWLEFRRSHIGGSDCPIIMGKSPYRTPYALWKEKLFDEKVSITSSMRRGSEMETEAREWFNQKTDANFRPEVKCHSEIYWQMASLDGFDEKNPEFLLEIKCPGENVLAEVDKGQIPEHWIWQIQHQLHVTHLKKAILLAYSPSKQVEVWIGRDERMIEDLNAKESVFYYKHLLEWEAPPLTEKDYVQRTDSDWLLQAEITKKAQQQAILAEKEYKLQKKKLEELSREECCQGNGIKFTRYSVPGRVDYTAIPELKNYDLSPYRKKATWSWRLT